MEDLIKQRIFLSLELGLTETNTQSHILTMIYVVKLQVKYRNLLNLSHLTSPITPSALALRHRATVSLSSGPFLSAVSSADIPSHYQASLQLTEQQRPEQRLCLLDGCGPEGVRDTVTGRRWDREEERGPKRHKRSGAEEEVLKWNLKKPTSANKWVLNRALNRKITRQLTTKRFLLSLTRHKILRQDSLQLNIPILPTVLLQWVSTGTCMSLRLIYRHLAQTLLVHIAQMASVATPDVVFPRIWTSFWLAVQNLQNP